MDDTVQPSTLYRHESIFDMYEKLTNHSGHLPKNIFYKEREKKGGGKEWKRENNGFTLLIRALIPS